MNRRYMLALLFALLLDTTDLFIGWIPVAGDALDAVGLFVLALLIGVNSLLGIAEFVPFLDFLPFFTVAVLLSRKKFGGQASG